MIKKILVICIFILFLFLFLYSGYYSLKYTYIFLESKNWPSAKGSILNVQVNKSTDQFAQIDLYFPAIEYDYTVNNIIFYSDNIYSSNYKAGFAAKKQALLFLSYYQTGNKIEVYYNPLNHDESHLKSRFNLFNIFILLFSIFWIVILFLIYCTGISIEIPMK